MDSEIKIIISFLYKRSGKKQMSFSELYLSLSMDLNWFTPDDAKKFLNYSIKNKFLTKIGNLIEPNIDISKVIIPLGFSPSKKIQFIEEAKELGNEEDLLGEIVNSIIERTNLTYEDVSEKIINFSKEKNLYAEVAALLIAKEYEIDFKALYEKIENKIII
jgi:hypothetical protein